MAQSDKQPSAENSVVPTRNIVRRGLAWLLSSAHLVLSGTTAAILVIIFLGSVFLFIALRNYRRDEIRMHAVQVTRLSSVIENDVAELENNYRAFLLTARYTPHRRVPKKEARLTMHREASSCCVSFPYFSAA